MQVTAGSAYNLLWAPHPPELPLQMGDLDSHVTHDALGPCEPTTQTAPRLLSSGDIVRTNMKRVCGFAISHIAMHYYAALQRVAWSVTLSVCHTTEPYKNG